MLCQKCNQYPATTHIHTYINGVESEVNLCAKCAAESGYAGFSGLGFGDLLGSLFGESLSSQPPAADTPRCKCCGASFSDIAESGRMGCGNCYPTFIDQLMPSLQRIHGKTRHVGKVPPTAPPEVRAASRLQKLKAELARTVEAEEFEKAAALRDEIRQLEGQEPNHEE